MLTKNKESARIVDAQDVIAQGANTVTIRKSVVSEFSARPADATSMQTLRLVEHSGILDFWVDDEEDIYTLNDGQGL